MVGRTSRDWRYAAKTALGTRTSVRSDIITGVGRSGGREFADNLHYVNLLVFQVARALP